MIDFWNWSEFLILGNRTTSQSEEHWISFCSYSLRQWKTEQVKATKAKPQVRWTITTTYREAHVCELFYQAVHDPGLILLARCLHALGKQARDSINGLLPISILVRCTSKTWSVFHININVIKWYINTFTYKVFKELQTT